MVPCSETNVMNLSSDDVEPRLLLPSPSRLQAPSWLWMLECAVVLKEIMKTSDHNAASIVVLQVVAMDAFLICK